MKGFIALPLIAYAGLAALAVVVVLSGALYIQSSRLETCKESYAAFKADVERLGKEAEAKAKAQVQKQKGATNAVRADLNTALRRLRESSGGRDLPAPAVSPESADATPVQLRPSCTILRERATDDALRLHFFQEFVRAQGFPVE